MELRFGVVSVDDHVQEHPEVWTSHLSRARWGDRIPHLKEQVDGSQRWVVDGRPLDLAGVAPAGAALPDRAQVLRRWDDVPRSAYIAADRLRAMDVDRIDYQVLYPTVAGVAGETFGRIADADLELACVVAYNDWLVEEWAAVSPRFVPQCIVPISSADAAATEIRRAVKRGHRGVVFPAVPWHLKEVPHINDPAWDPVWAACQEIGLPLCLHAGSSDRIRLAPWTGFNQSTAAAMDAIFRPVSSVLVMANLLFSPILTKFPKLKVVFSETSLAWGAYELETADHQFERQRLHLEGYTLKPSELFRRQCYMTGWYDQAALKVRHYLGVDNILWGSSFPFATSTWPNTRDYIQRSFDGVPKRERAKMLALNAAKLYKL